MSSMRPFGLTETEFQPDSRLIAIAGELDLAVADQLTAVLARASGCSLVLVDLGSCEFIDSTGLAAFVQASSQIEGEGGRFAVFGASDQVLRVLSVTGLTENGLVFESVEEAFAAGQAPAA
jgi:anti-anti-sigma factor